MPTTYGFLTSLSIGSKGSPNEMLASYSSPAKHVNRREWGTRRLPILISLTYMLRSDQCLTGPLGKHSLDAMLTFCE